MATDGSTNGVLHLQSIAAELYMDLSPSMFNEVSQSTPFICRISLNSAGLMQDLVEAGGIPAVMKEFEEVFDTISIDVENAKLDLLVDEVKKSVDAKHGEHRSRESRMAICRSTHATSTRHLEVRRLSTVSLQSISHRG